MESISYYQEHIDPIGPITEPAKRIVERSGDRGHLPVGSPQPEWSDHLTTGRIQARVLPGRGPAGLVGGRLSG